jgi:hypothetical protein
METEDFEHFAKLGMPKSPEEILGLTPNANIAQIEYAYNERRQRLEDEKAEGQKGAGGRVIPDKEFDERMSQIENAHSKLMENATEEAEIVTAELDPDFPKKLLQ